MNVIYRYKIASKLFSVCVLLDKYFICQIINSRQNFVLPKPFHKNTRTIRVILLYTFSSLIISIHIRILESLLEKFLSNFYMFQTPRLLLGFSYNLHWLATLQLFITCIQVFHMLLDQNKPHCIHTKKEHLQ